MAGHDPNLLHMRILAVDDEEDVRLLLEGALGMEPDVELTLAASGADALEYAATTVFDTVILDGLMPGMDGATVCRRLRERAEYANAPIVFLTALDDAARDELRRAGATGFIT